LPQGTVVKNARNKLKRKKTTRVFYLYRD